MFDGYIICGTPRTGSTLLCNLLTSTGRAGRPNSFYRRQNIREWAEGWRVPEPAQIGEAAFEAAYLKAAIEAGTNGTPLFGFRLMGENRGELLEILDRLFPGRTTDKDRFQQAFGRLLYVHLSRTDKLDQAISLEKARQSGLWHRAPDGSELERLSPPKEPVYDFGALRQQVAELEQLDRAWETWFDEQGIEPHRITYDELSADPAGALIRMFEALGVPAPDRSSVRPGVAKLADDVSAEWAQRYRNDTSDQK